MKNNSSAICPLCNGTTRIALQEYLRGYIKVLSTYDANTDTIMCKNCGGQEMYGVATGRVNLNRYGEPCLHRYKVYRIGQCLHRNKCLDCDSQFDIDSSD